MLPTTTLSLGDRAELAGTSVVVVEEVEVLRAGITQVLRRLGLAVIGEASTADDLVALVADRAPTLVVIGENLDVRVSAVVGALPSACRVVHLAGTTGRDEYVALLKAGTRAIVPLAAGTAELGDTLLRVLAGERVFAGTALAAVRSELSAHDGAQVPISPRERQVLALLSTRRTLAEIGAELYVSVATIKTHARNLYAKLGARCRADAVERAVALGLLG